MFKTSIYAIVALASVTALAAPTPTANEPSLVDREASDAVPTTPGHPCTATPVLLGNGDPHVNYLHRIVQYADANGPYKSTPTTRSMPFYYDKSFSRAGDAIQFIDDAAHSVDSAAKVDVPKDFSCPAAANTHACLIARMPSTAYTVQFNNQCNIPNGQNLIFYSGLKDQAKAGVSFYCLYGADCDRGGLIQIELSDKKSLPGN